LRIAGVPGFNPVTRALTTCSPLSRPLFTSTSPACGSVAPTFTARFPILPSSMVNTYDCPASSRIAVAGTTVAGAVFSRAICPLANMPPRSTPSRFATEM
jgi:hypothetical protein